MCAVPTNRGSCLLVLAGLLGGGALRQQRRACLTVLAPVHNERLADEEQHSRDLGDGEEAPDGGLLHEVVRDEARQERAGHPQEHALHNHALLLVQRKERREHEEAVDRGTGDVVRRVGHGDAPCQVELAVERAQLLAAEPLGALVAGDGVTRQVRRKDEAHEQSEAADEAQPLDHAVLPQVLLALGLRHTATTTVSVPC